MRNNFLRIVEGSHKSQLIYCSTFLVHKCRDDYTHKFSVINLLLDVFAVIVYKLEPIESVIDIFYHIALRILHNILYNSVVVSMHIWKRTRNL